MASTGGAANASQIGGIKPAGMAEKGEGDGLAPKGTPVASVTNLGCVDVPSLAIPGNREGIGEEAEIGTRGEDEGKSEKVSPKGETLEPCRGLSEKLKSSENSVATCRTARYPHDSCVQSPEELPASTNSSPDPHVPIAEPSKIPRTVVTDATGAPDRVGVLPDDNNEDIRGNTTPGQTLRRPREDGANPTHPTYNPVKTKPSTDPGLVGADVVPSSSSASSISPSTSTFIAYFRQHTL